MPTQEETARGVRGYRTISLPNGKYLHVALVKKKGKRGGHTVAGPVHQKLDWNTPPHIADQILRDRGHR